MMDEKSATEETKCGYVCIFGLFGLLFLSIEYFRIAFK